MRKATAVKLAILIAIVGGTAFFALRQRQARPLAIGDRAPDFSLPAFPSGSLDLETYRGQVVLVHFWATWCPPCVEETPGLVRFSERMRNQGVAVVSVSVDENPEALRDFIEKYRISYPVGRDPKQTLAARYGTFLFPETYILDRGGFLAEKVANAADWSDPRMQNFVLNLTHSSRQ